MHLASGNNRNFELHLKINSLSSSFIPCLLRMCLLTSGIGGGWLFSLFWVSSFSEWILLNILPLFACLFVLFCFVYFSFGVEADKQEVRKTRHFSFAWHFCKLACYSQNLADVWRLFFCEYFSKFTRGHHWEISIAFCIMHFSLISFIMDPYEYGQLPSSFQKVRSHYPLRTHYRVGSKVTLNSSLFLVAHLCITAINYFIWSLLIVNI